MKSEFQVQSVQKNPDLLHLAPKPCSQLKSGESQDRVGTIYIFKSQKYDSDAVTNLFLLDGQISVLPKNFLIEF